MAKVLIADDEPSMRALMRMTLETGKVEILEAEDGVTAGELVRSERPDLVFLDWTMPGRSGIEVCRDVRADPSVAGTKIVMVTARVQDQERDAGYAAGADGYMTKPFSPLELLDKVVEVLGPQALL